jgi:hypothetical protein
MLNPHAMENDNWPDGIFNPSPIATDLDVTAADAYSVPTVMAENTARWSTVAAPAADAVNTISALLVAVAVTVLGTPAVIFIRLELPVRVKIFSAPAPWGSPKYVVIYRVATAPGVVFPVTQFNSVLDTVVVNAAMFQVSF